MADRAFFTFWTFDSRSKSVFCIFSGTLSIRDPHRSEYEKDPRRRLRNSGSRFRRNGRHAIDGEKRVTVLSKRKHFVGDLKQEISQSSSEFTRRRLFQLHELHEVAVRRVLEQEISAVISAPSLQTISSAVRSAVSVFRLNVVPEVLPAVILTAYLLSVPPSRLNVVVPSPSQMTPHAGSPFVVYFPGTPSDSVPPERFSVAGEIQRCRCRRFDFWKTGSFHGSSGKIWFMDHRGAKMQQKGQYILHKNFHCIYFTPQRISVNQNFQKNLKTKNLSYNDQPIATKDTKKALPRKQKCFSSSFQLSIGASTDRIYRFSRNSRSL